MKLLTPLFSSTLLLGLTFLNATPTGAELTKKNCATCHMLDVPTPDMIPTLKAPPMHSVLYHIKEDTTDVEKQKAFIVEFALNPTLSKSVCESNQVQRFGLMPSQKGLVSKEDLEVIAEHLVKTFPSNKFVSMIKEMQTNGKMNGLINSPFLMNQDELPHLTKILMQNWDKGTLALTKEQKEKLLTVRTETMTGVKKIKTALKSLNETIIEMTVDEEELSKIQIKVEEVSKLKTEATMIHIKCLQESIKILNDEQLELLLPFWDS